jgi:HK97 family phage major capsid protein
MTEGLTVSRLLSAGPPPAPGGWRGALYRPDAPGAVLDGQPWARSWPAFMRAITTPHDAGARQFIANAMSEKIPSEGGFLVPEVLRSEVLEYMTAALIRPRAMVLPMGAERLALPVLDNLTQASETQALGGLTFAWTESKAGITPSIPAFGRTVLEARKAAAYMQGVSNDFVEDAAGAFGDFTGRVISLGYSWFEDDSFINGTGAGEPQGLINAPCQVTVTRNTSSKVLFPDIAAMFKALAPASKQYGLVPEVTDVCWLLSASVMDWILELYYNPSGTEVVSPSGWFTMGDGKNAGPSLLGLPALVTDHQPAVGTTGDIILADLRHYVIADRMAMTIERSAESPGAFGSDTSNFRVKARLDGRYWIQSAFTTEAGQSVSPVVVLT